MTVAMRSLLLCVVMSAGLAPCLAGGADSRLIDQSGHTVSGDELNGHWLLVYFGYTTCREICPAALTSMSAVLNKLGAGGNALQPLFVTLDPTHDSPEVMRAFMAHFHPRIRGLTGSTAAIADAARTFNVPWQANSNIVDHGTLFYLVAPDGRVVQMLHPQQPVDELVAAIRRQLSDVPSA
jgi:cytochrome oxidase Cu insertion factor (SCO1/SenC/PrrC family)